MSWLQLSPEETLERIRRSTAGDAAASVPSLRSSVLRGTLGFTAVSIAGFVPWAIFGRPISRAVGEAGMYACCALVFMALSGPLLHRLIAGPGSLKRFLALFSAAFTVYSVLWIIGWMTLRGHPGSLVGLGAGTASMAWVLTRAFRAGREWLAVFLLLFVLNAAGYFIGGWVEGAVMNQADPAWFGSPVPRRTQARTAMLLWGVFYGLGFGAGLGLAFHRCQQGLRSLIGSPN